ncbi:hypothetical protein Fmac_010713 [Flemingia macrophylla]|uniref:Uncharacterized protein n=1 Tax=Flemingia macrophylla TaxID=520843 RepID=A0ABD1MKD0_9FABA
MSVLWASRHYIFAVRHATPPRRVTPSRRSSPRRAFPPPHLASLHRDVPQVTPPRRVTQPRRSSPRRPPRLALTSRLASPRRLTPLHLASTLCRLARSRLAAISPHPPNGGASGMLATYVIQPIDMINVMSSSHLFVLIPPNGIIGLSDFRCGIQIYSFCVRIQLGQGSAAQVTTTMLKNEGVAAFYKYGQMVCAVFPSLVCIYLAIDLQVKEGASSVSGFFAAACSFPFDYVKTQIQKMQPDAVAFLVAFLLLIVLLDSHIWSSL